MTALLTDGKAQLLASRRGQAARTLGVWDNRPGDGLGGTASFIGHAVAQKRIVRAIDPLTGVAFMPGDDAIAAAQRCIWSRLQVGSMFLEHRLMAFLFADAKGFGLVRETQIPAFARVLSGIIEAVLQNCGVRPL